jgi:3-isopropylmalate/(R)-2-methylmalate dehydratase large subunit
MPRPMTITEKILANSAGVPEVVPGQILNVKIGLAYTMDTLGKLVFDNLHKLGIDSVFDKDRVVIVFDHQAPAPNSKWADLHNIIRKEAKEFGVRLYDIGENGMMHQMVVQEGHLVPGIVAIGTDSHALTGGAVGAVTMGMGTTDAVIAMATGELWLRVPEPVKVVLAGNFPTGVMARDVMSHLFRQKGWDGSEAKWTYRAVEFSGETIDGMNMEERLSLCNFLSDSGAKNGIIAPDEITLDYVKPRAKKNFQLFQSDAEADYEEVIMVEVNDLEPQIACPHSPDNVKPVSEVAGTKVNVAFIGSCTNGRLGDIRVAARILKGRKIHPGVRMTVSPSSQSIYKQALNEGLFNILSDAGVLIAPSTCGPCFGGQLVVLAQGDVAISSSARNLKGRMGSPEAQIYSANPAVVAASAVSGEITDPRKFL